MLDSIRPKKSTIYLYLLIHHVLTDGTGIQTILKSLKAAFRGDEMQPDGYYSWPGMPSAASDPRAAGISPPG